MPDLPPGCWSLSTTCGRKQCRKQVHSMPYDWMVARYSIQNQSPLAAIEALSKVLMCSRLFSAEMVPVWVSNRAISTRNCEDLVDRHLTSIMPLAGYVDICGPTTLHQSLRVCCTEYRCQSFFRVSVGEDPSSGRSHTTMIYRAAPHLAQPLNGISPSGTCSIRLTLYCTNASL